ncbi:MULTISPECIES: thiol reductant ABC exporter subunit CydD [Actinomyces]|uniref:Thiol reductant ABC exporter subunit CydD n=1 Tax=Actinomyces respiraculi TaxID=2744574 RepID=A0A7T0LJ80_9ACTO|nr:MULTISPECIES: thiol reductant ABC exporter subunit CydD [Actinomyces]QPL04682.1 thiol reductant ABC exporter subunit CydD [Actinomyces respiraculi]
MKPLDPRLMRYARTARRYIVFTALSGLVLSLLVIGQAWLISRIISPVITGQAHADQVMPLVGALAVVVLARAGVLHLQEARAHRAAVGTTIELRRQVLEHAAALGPRWQTEHASETATLLTRGLDDLEPYLTRYLPQLLLAATATPLLGLVMLMQDLASTVVVVLTMPLIPIFMILIGRLTERHSKDRLDAMERLGSQVLDLIAGLPTLKAFGREVGPGRRVKALGRAYNRTTMTTLRVAFLSGAVLEFLTTLSVAIIAVEVGFRLLFGHLDLATGLLVIMIAPEVYQPLRQVGFQFHASANGAAAANAVFTVLQTPLPTRGSLPAPDVSTATLEIEDLSVRARGSWAPGGLTATIRPGRLTALAGPSGAGKTTTSQVLLHLLEPDRGSVHVLAADGARTDLEDISPTSWWEQVTLVPQRPTIVPGTLLDNVLGPEAAQRPGAHEDPALQAAARACGLDEVVATLDEGWHQRIGQGGVGLSVGQRQRLALTRALLERTPLVVLDEPTAHLDAASEAHVVDAVEALRAASRTVIVIAHRSALLAVADDVITVSSVPLEEADPDDGAGSDEPHATAPAQGLKEEQR